MTDPKIAMADLIYTEEKPGAKHRVTVAIIEKRLGLKPNQLHWYRSNACRRKARKVTRP